MIVGTMPGVASLQAQEYYANPHNQFWRIMAEVLGVAQPWQSYAQKLVVLQSHQIGLWDALETCEREGSLDADIKNATSNDFAQYPQIERFLFNGKKAFDYFKRHQAHLLTEENHAVLPSTSPANATLKYAQKLSLWRLAILKGRNNNV